jgi:hypothetical protein
VIHGADSSGVGILPQQRRLKWTAHALGLAWLRLANRRSFIKTCGTENHAGQNFTQQNPLRDWTYPLCRAFGWQRLAHFANGSKNGYPRAIIVGFATTH